MNYQNKFISALIFLLSLSLIGCGGKTGISTKPDEQSTESMPTVIETVEAAEDDEFVEPDIAMGTLLSTVADPVQLTSGSFDNGIGAFHPDGKSIVFQSLRNGHWQIYSMSLMSEEDTGTTVTETVLFQSGSNDENPVWTKDGSKLLFVSDRDRKSMDDGEWQRDVYLYDPSSIDNPVIRLTDDPTDDWYPVPYDDESFLFLSERDSDSGLPVHARKNSLYKGFYDGSQPVQVAGPDIDPSSPVGIIDGDLLFRNQEGRLVSFSLYQGEVDADRGRAITKSDLRCGGGTVSSMNNWLAFNARNDDDLLYKLYLLDISPHSASDSLTTNMMQKIETLNSEIRYPQFSPDGSWLMFTSEVDGNFQLFRLPLNRQ